jgi:hypothetical protein
MIVRRHASVGSGEMTVAAVERESVEPHNSAGTNGLRLYVTPSKFRVQSALQSTIDLDFGTPHGTAWDGSWDGSTEQDFPVNQSLGRVGRLQQLNGGYAGSFYSSPSIFLPKHLSA